MFWSLDGSGGKILEKILPAAIEHPVADCGCAWINPENTLGGNGQVLLDSG